VLLDWITVWQSELTALAADREARENWQAAVGAMAGAMRAIAPLIAAAGVPGRGDERSAGGAGTAEPPRPAPASSAPDAGNGELERLARRVAELERRLARPARPSRPGRARKRPL
jgi:hypothetical protein